MSSGALGRRTPTDFNHIDKYPLTASTAPTAPRPMAIGVNWYSAFDTPVKDKFGHYWIGQDAQHLGSVRGGHCVCLKHKGGIDLTSWWDFYDQGAEGACVGFGTSRMMSLLNRKRYFARWLWDHAKLIDEWSDTNPGDDNGTSVRAALDVLRTAGHVAWKASDSKIDGNVEARDARQPVAGEGIAANRWATSTDDALRTLGYVDLGYVDVLNSWGRAGYPHLTRMPVETLDRLLREDGEFGVITDR